MSKFNYFKVNFISYSVGITVGFIVYGLFDADFSNTNALMKLVLKSILFGIIIGASVSVTNLIFKGKDN